MTHKFQSIPVVVASICLLALLAPGCGGDDEPAPTTPAPCSISNVYTDLGTSFLTGQSNAVTWDRTGSAATVDIHLLQGGAVVETIAAGTDNDGRRNWLVDLGEHEGADDFSIRVSAVGETGCSASLDGVEITNVDGCSFVPAEVTDTLTGDTAYTIEWTSLRTTGVVDIELWYVPPATGAEYVAPIAYGVPDAGSYLWNKVDTFNYKPDEVTHDYYVFRILDAEVGGCEAYSETFRIEDPSICSIAIGGLVEGFNYSEGATVQVSLNHAGGSGEADLFLYAGLELVDSIETDVDTALPYDWTVSRYMHTGGSGAYAIRAVDSADGTCVGMSVRFGIVD